MTEYARTSDLVKRLRYRAVNPDGPEAAALIETLKAMIDWMENMDPMLVENARGVVEKGYPVKP